MEEFKVGDEVMWEEADNMAVIGTVVDVFEATEETLGHHGYVVKELYAASIWGESDLGKGTLHTVDAEWVKKHEQKEFAG